MDEVGFLLCLILLKTLIIWTRCEFIRLRMQYGTEIFSKIEYHTITYWQKKTSIWMSFFCLLRIVLGEALLSAVTFMYKKSPTQTK